MYAALQRFLELKFADEKDTKRPKWSLQRSAEAGGHGGEAHQDAAAPAWVAGERIHLLYRFEGADGSKDARETGVKLEGAEGSG